MNCLARSNRINGVKTEPTVRNVQHDSAVIRLKVDIGEPVQCGPSSLGGVLGSSMALSFFFANHSAKLAGWRPQSQAEDALTSAAESR